MTDFDKQRETQQEVVLNLPEQSEHTQSVFTSLCEESSLPYPDLAPVVFFRLKQTTRPRNWCLQIACCPCLNYMSVLMILLNCAILSRYKPCGDTNPNLEAFEGCIFAFFMMEMMIKMVALGVYGHKTSYLRDSWHKLDVLINSGELLDYFLASLGIHLNMCQALGPMRLISRVPSMRELATVLLDTMPMLGNTLILYALVIHIFSIVGVQLWAGQLRNRCFLGEDVAEKYNVSLSPYYMSKDGEKYPFICSLDGNHGMLQCHDVPPFREDGKTCSLAAPHNTSAADTFIPTVAGASSNSCVNWNKYYNICRAGDDNPQMGAINFDHIGYAWITIFQVVTLEGWAEIMFYVMDAYSFWSFGFFILVTIAGNFIMMNVCAVVIATQFAEKMGTQRRDQQVTIVSMARLFFMRLLQGISSRCKRRRNKVHSDASMDKVLTVIWTSYSKKLERAVNSKLFDRMVLFIVFLSVFTMAIEHHQQPKELTRMLEISNNIFICIFFVEMVVKLLALSWGYFNDRNNLFDFAIVMISLWEVFSKADGRLSVLRAFRLLRFVRLINFLPYLKRQLLVLTRAMEEGATLCKLLLLTVFVFSLLGMHFFGCKFSFDAQNGDINTDRKNFDTLLWSSVTVFQILTQEDWNFVLYNAMAATTPWAALYLVVLIIFGKHVLLNILVGIMVQSFQAQHPSDSQTDLRTNKEIDSSRPNQDCALSHCGPSESSAVNSAAVEESAATVNNEDNRSLNVIQKVLHWCKEHEDWSFYIFSPKNKFRAFCYRLVSHKMFDNTILIIILLNCVTIALERPDIHPKSTERWILTVSSYMFSVVFLVEMLFKVFALGLLIGKESYFRSSWNVIDGSLVILSLVHVLVSLLSASNNNTLSILKVLRLLRTLRPLRVIKRAPKLKLAVQALMASLKPIGNIVLICCAFFFFFGILGVQLFKGKFDYCVGQDTRNITTKSECLSANYLWLRKEYNFDNLPQALMSLFVMYSKDGWVNLMYDGVDAVGVDKQPVRNHNEWMVLFFISFMIISFFLLDMFIGVMVETFHQCQQEQKKDQELQEEELLQVQSRRQENGGAELEEMPYYTRYSPFRQSIYYLCTSNFLELFMNVIIFISVLMMAFEHYNQPEYFERVTEYSHYVFTIILVIEVLLKLVAFGVVKFMKSSWNVLDIAVVLVSIISIVLNKVKMADTIPINPSILRICRVLRLTLVLKAKNIRVLLKTIIKTLSQVGNICLLFMFFFSIYAALGVELFGKLECTVDRPCLGLHRHANFKHFGRALLTLYQVCTGDNWSGIMKDTLRECGPDDVGCLSYLSWVAPMYFISFVVMAQFVLVNLVVAAIMQALEDSNEKKSNNHCLPPEEEEAQNTLQAPSPGSESEPAPATSTPLSDDTQD